MLRHSMWPAVYVIAPLALMFFIARQSAFGQSSEGPAFTSARSPDGTVIITADADGSLFIARAPDFSHTTRLTGPHQAVSAIVWSPNGRQIAVVGERTGDKGPPGYPWGTIWLVDLKSPPSEKDLLLPGSPFQTPGRRSLGISKWLDDGRIVFSMACGTGCVGHYAVNTIDDSYQFFCIGRGELYWAPDGKKAVIENDSSGPDPQGLGLIEASSAVALLPGQSPFQYDRACKSAFEGGPRIDDPGEFPRFARWSPDSRYVLYTDLTKHRARVWDTATGKRTAAANRRVK